MGNVGGPSSGLSPSTLTYHQSTKGVTLHPDSGNFPVNLQIHGRPPWAQLIICGEEAIAPVKGEMAVTRPPEATQTVSSLLGFAGPTPL